MINQIKKNNVSDQIYQQMMEMIISGTWKEGQLIPSENMLSEEFGVSRDSVRQAIHKLSALGLLKSRQGKGTYVQRLDIGFYMNLLVPSLLLNENDSITVLEFAKSIQVESVRLVCRNATREQIEKLSIYLEQMEVEKDYELYFEEDMGYHIYLSSLTRNALFIKAMDIIKILLHEYLRDVVAVHGSKRSIEQHEECYRALLDRDEERAIYIMGEHYDMLIDRVTHFLHNKSVTSPGQ